MYLFQTCFVVTAIISGYKIVYKDLDFIESRRIFIFIQVIFIFGDDDHGYVYDLEKSDGDAALAWIIIIS